jgi:dephospho-CoA kinase
MIKIGITGSISSGKTTTSKIISKSKGPLFSADRVVKNLYLKKNFKSKVAKLLKISTNTHFKKRVKKKILENENNIKVLEKIIHPFVRKEMFSFIKRNRNKNFLFFEIPLLIESNLSKNFDSIVFVKANKKIRLRRYIKSGGKKKIFELLDKLQMKDILKMRFCDYVIVNNKSINVLKNKISNIIKV